MNRHPILQDFWDLQRVRAQAADDARRVAPEDFQSRITATLTDAYATLAEALRSEGFRYSRRHSWLSRRRDDLVHRIAFTTSNANIPDTFIALYPTFWVLCPNMAPWRKSFGRVPADNVAIRALSSFEPDGASIEHDIGPTDTRLAEIADLEARIRDRALHFFDAFKNADAAVISASNWPSVGFASYEIEPAIEYALFQDRRDIAQTLVHRFFARHPTLLSDYFAFASGERTWPSSDGPDVFAHHIATLVRQHQLDGPAAV